MVVSVDKGDEDGGVIATVGMDTVAGEALRTLMGVVVFALMLLPPLFNLLPFLPLMSHSSSSAKKFCSAKAARNSRISCFNSFVSFSCSVSA